MEKGQQQQLKQYDTRTDEEEIEKKISLATAHI